MLQVIISPSSIAVLREALRRSLFRPAFADVWALLNDASDTLGAPARAHIQAGNAVAEVASTCLGDACSLLTAALAVEVSRRSDIAAWLASMRGRSASRITEPRTAA